MFRSMKAPSPYCYRCPFGLEKDTCSLECLDRFHSILKRNAGRLSAILIEPILMGAGGMIIYPADYLKGVYGLAKKYNVHLIADEVATGFARTGKMFACEHAGVDPDFMCLSKGITSGYLPLGVTLTTDKIYDAFCGDYGKYKTFYHGHTYTANPIVCSAARASLELFEDGKSMDKVMRVNALLRAFLEDIGGMEFVGDTRSIGLVGAAELVKDKASKKAFDPQMRIGYEIYKKGLSKGLLLRPLGDIIYFFLPLCVKEEELKDIFEKTRSALTSVFAALK